MEELDHVVFMGMGEPMMNLDNVLDATRACPTSGSPTGGPRSPPWAGCPGIERLTASDLPVRLALSLHAADDDLRTQIMPVNARYPLGDVLAACERFYEVKRRQVFVEYVMLKGVNDRYEQAVALAERLDPRIYKVNLIPYNPTGMYDGSSARRSTPSARSWRSTGCARPSGSPAGGTSTRPAASSRRRPRRRVTPRPADEAVVSSTPRWATRACGARSSPTSAGCGRSRTTCAATASRRFPRASTPWPPTCSGSSTSGDSAAAASSARRSAGAWASRWPHAPERSAALVLLGSGLGPAVRRRTAKVSAYEAVEQRPNRRGRTRRRPST
jgi:hypothetical protein